MTTSKHEALDEAIRADLALGILFQMGNPTREEAVLYTREKGIEMHLVPFLERMGLLDDDWWEYIRRMNVPVPGRLH